MPNGVHAVHVLPCARRPVAGLPGPVPVPRPRHPARRRASTTRSSSRKTASSASSCSSEFLDLDLRHRPGLTRVSTGHEALALARGAALQPRHHARRRRRHGRARARARRARGRPRHRRSCSLAYDARELVGSAATQRHSASTGCSSGRATSRILLAIVKYVEDRLNVAHDTGEMGVQVDHRDRGQRPATTRRSCPSSTPS